MANGIRRLETGIQSSDIYFTPPFLIDAGRNAQKVSSKIKNSNLEEEIEYLFLTHSHYDHIAASWELVEEFDLKVIAHELTRDAVKNKNKKLTLSNLFKGTLDEFNVDIVIKDDRKLLDSEIILTPGHSDTGISLVRKNLNAAFTGDLFFPGPKIARTDLFTGDADKLKKSLDKLLNLSVENYFTGHGGSANREELESLIKNYRMKK